jgi:hypothetical protein
MAVESFSIERDVTWDPGAGVLTTEEISWTIS